MWFLLQYNTDETQQMMKFQFADEKLSFWLCGWSTEYKKRKWERKKERKRVKEYGETVESAKVTKLNSTYIWETVTLW